VYTVIGVVADSRNTSLKSAPPRMAYLHYKDNPPYATFFVVRSAEAPEALTARVRQTIWKQAPETTIARVKTLDAQVRDSLASERFQTEMLAAFGAAALLLAMLGIYGVLSYSVAGRSQEIGVRMALGATPPQIYSLTLGETAAPVVAGLAGGVAASVILANGVEKLLYGVKALEPTVAMVTVGLFLLAALAAAFLPARRAALIDPMQALRAE
jgi:ABC-type antimicrobial peptide transport system permease subunit